MTIFIGIDPGAQGALCALDTQTKLLSFCPTPNPNHLTKPVLVKHVATWLTFHSTHAMIIGIEDVHSVFGSSAKSNFQFGRYLGLIEALAMQCKCGVTYVQPKVWQKGCGIIFPKGTKKPDKKKITAEKALELYPNADVYGPMGGLKDARTDSLMIAHYLHLQYIGAQS